MQGYRRCEQLLSEQDRAGIRRQVAYSYTDKNWTRIIDVWNRLSEGDRHAIITESPEAAGWIAEALYQAGMELGRRGNTKAAVQHLEQALPLASGHLRLQYELALMYHRRGQWVQAVQLYEALFETGFDPERLAYHICLVCLQSGKELGEGQLFDRTLARIAELRRQEPADLPWHWRRLCALRTYALTGSLDELLRLHADSSGKKGHDHLPHSGWALLSLEEGLVVALNGKVEAGRRRIMEPASSADHGLRTLVTAVSAVLSARAGYPNRARDLAVQATNLLGTWLDTGQAGSESDRLIRQTVESAVARANWEAGLLLWWRQKADEAYSLWEAALQLSPGNPALIQNIALALEATDNLEASDAWQNLLKPWELEWRKKGAWLRPEFGWAYSLMVRRATEQPYVKGDLSTVHRLLRRAANIVEDDPDLLLWVIGLDRLFGRDGQATDYVRKLLAMDLSKLTLLSDLITELCDNDQFPAAERLLNGILDKKPEHPEALRLLIDVLLQHGESLFQHGDWLKAEKRFVSALELDPECAPAHMWLGGIQLLTGRPELAEAAFKQALASDTFDEKVAHAEVAIGCYLLEAGKKEEALERFAHAVDYGKNKPEIHVGIGVHMVECGLVDEGVRHMFQAARLSDYDASLLTPCVQCLIDQGYFEPALQVLDETMAHHDVPLELWSLRILLEYMVKGDKADRRLIRKVRRLAVAERDMELVGLIDDLLAQLDRAQHKQLPRW